jgi:hypothetical protein
MGKSSEYWQLVRELRAAARKQAVTEKGAEMRKATGPTFYVGDMNSIRRAIAELTRPKANTMRKALPDAESHPMVLALKPVLDLQAARVKYAKMNAALTRAASTGNISAHDAAKAENQLNDLAVLIQQLEGTSVESGESANARNRRGPQ